MIFVSPFLMAVSFRCFSRVVLFRAFLFAHFYTRAISAHSSSSFFPERAHSHTSTHQVKTHEKKKSIFEEKKMERLIRKKRNPVKKPKISKKFWIAIILFAAEFAVLAMPATRNQKIEDGYPCYDYDDLGFLREEDCLDMEMKKPEKLHSDDRIRCTDFCLREFSPIFENRVQRADDLCEDWFELDYYSYEGNYYYFVKNKIINFFWPFF